MPELDLDAVFGDDYLYFYGERLGDEVSDRETELIWRLLGLERGLAVLDAPCGHGRIANRLAEGGCRVVGLDASARFLEVARTDAAARGVEVEYVEGDLRRLSWEGRFDRALCWFTSFGYFDDEDNRRVLAEFHRVLRPGGVLLLELIHLLFVARALPPGQDTSTVVSDAPGDDLLADRHRLDPLTGRVDTERTTVRDGAVRKTSYSVRVPTFTELRDWLLAAGFARVEGYDETGEPLTANAHRLVVVAQRS